LRRIEVRDAAELVIIDDLDKELLFIVNV